MLRGISRPLRVPRAKEAYEPLIQKLYLKFSNALCETLESFMSSFLSSSQMHNNSKILSNLMSASKVQRGIAKVSLQTIKLGIPLTHEVSNGSLVKQINFHFIWFNPDLRIVKLWRVKRPDNDLLFMNISIELLPVTFRQRPSRFFQNFYKRF